MTHDIQNRTGLASATPRPEILRDYDVHPVAGLWPLLGEADLQEMAMDIQQHGLQEPIWMYEGQILDGRNRLVACNMAGVEPTFQQWKPSANGESPVTFIMTKNLHRRHLSAGTRAAVAVEIEEWMIAEKQRVKDEQAKIAANFSVQEKIVAPRAEAAPAVMSPFSLGDPATAVQPKKSVRTREEAAAAVGVSTGYLADAKDIKKASPEMFEKVAHGEVSIPKAQELLVDEAKIRGDLENLGLRPGAKRAAADRLAAREARVRDAKPRITIKKFTKVESSRVAITIDAVFGSSQKAEDWLNKMQDEPSVLDLDYTVHDPSEKKSKRRK